MLPSCIPRRARQPKTPATLNFTAGAPCGQRQELETKVKGTTHYLTSEHINPAVKGWAEERQRLAKNDRRLTTKKYGTVSEFRSEPASQLNYNIVWHCLPVFNRPRSLKHTVFVSLSICSHGLIRWSMNQP
eukprot:GHVN01007438.1.p1 GENE.GHVN01007438.1~~GHVN01007438.1.p1  ORF type:complete len:131 (+),score=3.70 GHVN01007438.1:64-456(+)